jgi:hypothetical protein
LPLSGLFTPALLRPCGTALVLHQPTSADPPWPVTSHAGGGAGADGAHLGEVVGGSPVPGREGAVSGRESEERQGEKGASARRPGSREGKSWSRVWCVGLHVIGTGKIG